MTTLERALARLDDAPTLWVPGAFNEGIRCVPFVDAIRILTEALATQESAPAVVDPSAAALEAELAHYMMSEGERRAREETGEWPDQPAPAREAPPVDLGKVLVAVDADREREIRKRHSDPEVLGFYREDIDDLLLALDAARADTARYDAKVTGLRTALQQREAELATARRDLRQCDESRQKEQAAAIRAEKECARLRGERDDLRMALHCIANTPPKDVPAKPVWWSRLVREMRDQAIAAAETQAPKEAPDVG